MKSLTYARHGMFPGKIILGRQAVLTACTSKKLMPGDLPFYVEGLLYLEKDDKVDETKLRYYPPTSCTTNVTSSLNKIRLLAGTQYIERSIIK